MNSLTPFETEKLFWLAGLVLAAIITWFVMTYASQHGGDDGPSIAASLALMLLCAFIISFIIAAIIVVALRQPGISP
jgi:hypothetical protein